MSRFRRAASRPTLGIDREQPEIVAALEAIGAVVTVLSTAGVPGLPDLLVSHRGRWHLLEVKSPLGPRGGGDRGAKLRQTQVEWISRQRAAVSVVRSVDDALEAVGAVRKRAQQDAFA